MKKTFLTTLSLCAFLISAVSANAAEKSKTSEVDAKEKARRAEIEKVSSCKNVLDECKKLGFVAGGFSEGKGLWRNCFQPVVDGKSATLNGKEVAVSANAQDVSACKTSISKK